MVNTDHQGYFMVNTDHPGYLMVNTDHTGYLMVNTDHPGHLMVNTDRPDYHIVNTDRPGYLVVNTDHPGYLVVNTDRPGYLVVNTDHPGYLMVNTDPGYLIVQSVLKPKSFIVHCYVVSCWVYIALQICMKPPFVVAWVIAQTSLSLSQPFTTQSPLLKTLKKKSFENIPSMFSTHPKNNFCF